MLDAHRYSLDVAERSFQLLGEHDRTVPSAGAAYGDGEVALPFLDVLRECEREKGGQPLDELARRRMPAHETDDGTVASRQRTQRVDEVRVRQAAHVEHQI